MTEQEAKAALAECRLLIDAIDRRIVEMLNERTRVVEQIGAIKQQTSMPIYEPKREEAVFANVTSNNSGPLSPEAAKRIFERIVDEMRTVQKTKMEKGN